MTETVAKSSVALPGSLALPVTAVLTAEICAALGQETRLETYRLLLRYRPFGLAAGDIARLLAVPHNTLSTHLRLLERAGLVQARRHGRSIVFSAADDRLAHVGAYLKEGVLSTAGERASANPLPRQRTSDETSNDGQLNVLILCSANAARSLMAEAIINREGRGRIKAFSAGSKPARQPHEGTMAMLAALGYDIAALRAKSWREFAGDTAPSMDLIITVCDAAAGEVCPQWPGEPLQIHWGIADPLGSGEPPEQQKLAVREAYRQIMNRATALINLPIMDLGLRAVQPLLQAIGRMEGATPLTLTHEISP